MPWKSQWAHLPFQFMEPADALAWHGMEIIKNAGKIIAMENLAGISWVNKWHGKIKTSPPHIYLAASTLLALDPAVTWREKCWEPTTVGRWIYSLQEFTYRYPLRSQPCRKTFTAGERILGYLLACVVRALPLDFTDSHFCFTFFLRENAGVCAPSFSAPRVTITLAIQYSCSTILPVAIVWAHIPVTESSA